MSASPPERRVLVSAALGAALTPLNSTMVAVALPALSEEFAAPASTVTILVVTGYLVATIVAQMPAGSIADRAGYARALTWGRWTFGAGALVGALAPSLSAVVAGRLLMAAGGALVVPTAMALVRIAVAPERRARAFGVMGTVLAGAAAVGPALGAWLAAHAGWRALFVINVPLLALSWLLQPPVLERSPAQRTDPFDVRGSVLIGVTLLALMTATRVGTPWGYWLGAFGVAAGVALLINERRVPAPVLDLTLFGRTGFVAGALVIATQNLAMYSVLIQVPFLFGSGSGSDAGLGLAITAMTATMAVASPFGGWLTEWAGLRAVVAAGGLVGAAGIVLLGRLPASASAAEVGACLLLVGLGIGLSTAPANAAAIGAVPPGQSAAASATVSVLRYLGAIVGTVILGVAFAGGADVIARHHVALWIFVAAFVASAVLGAMLPPPLKGRRYSEAAL